VALFEKVEKIFEKFYPLSKISVARVSRHINLIFLVALGKIPSVPVFKHTDNSGGGDGGSSIK
jgi:hypothetical protein